MSMLDPADAYVHAGLTAGAADMPARLITLRDLLELEARPEFDADAVLGRVRSWGAEAPVARAVTLVEDRLRPDRPPALAGWARQLRRRPGGPLPHALLHELGPQLPPPAGRGGVRAEWRDRAALLHALTVPQRAFLRARGWTRREHVRRGVRKLVR